MTLGRSRTRMVREGCSRAKFGGRRRLSRSLDFPGCSLSAPRATERAEGGSAAVGRAVRAGLCGLSLAPLRLDQPANLPAQRRQAPGELRVGPLECRDARVGPGEV